VDTGCGTTFGILHDTLEGSTRSTTFDSLQPEDLDMEEGNGGVKVIPRGTVLTGFLEAIGNPDTAPPNSDEIPKVVTAVICIQQFFNFWVSRIFTLRFGQLSLIK